MVQPDHSNGDKTSLAAQVRDCLERLDDVFPAGKVARNTIRAVFCKNASGTAWTPEQYDLVRDRATITARQFFNETAAESTSGDGLGSYLFHIFRDPVVKKMSIMDYTLQIAGNDFPARGGDEILVSLIDLNYLFSDITHNFSLFLPANDRRGRFPEPDSIDGFVSRVTDEYLPQIRYLTDAVAGALDHDNDTLAALKDERRAWYSHGKEHVHAISAQSWRLSL